MDELKKQILQKAFIDNGIIEIQEFELDNLINDAYILSHKEQEYLIFIHKFFEDFDRSKENTFRQLALAMQLIKDLYEVRNE